MSAASSVPGPRSWWSRLSQRQVFVLKLSALAILAVVAVALALYFREAATKPTMPEIVKASKAAMTLTPAQASDRSVDGIRFPDWSGEGWTLAGGRTDDLGHGRVAETALYRDGGRAVTLTIVSGTGEVENSKRADGTQVPVTRDGHTVTFTDFGYGANVLSDSALYIFKRTVNGRTVVLTGAPISPPLYKQMTALMVTGLDPWNGAVAATTP